jgi:hypothetical protein
MTALFAHPALALLFASRLTVPPVPVPGQCDDPLPIDPAVVTREMKLDGFGGGADFTAARWPVALRNGGWGQTTHMGRVVLALLMLSSPAVAPAQEAHFVGQGASSRLWLPPAMVAALHAADGSFVPYRETAYVPDLRQWYPSDSHARPYAVIADFNGDSRADVVVDGQSATRSRRIVLLSTGPEYRALILEDRPRNPASKADLTGEGQRTVYLSYVPPGRVDSSPELEAAPLDLRHEAFEVGYWEQAAVLYYWDGRAFAEYVTGD